MRDMRTLKVFVGILFYGAGAVLFVLSLIFYYNL